jgi:hypothetical protein
LVDCVTRLVKLSTPETTVLAVFSIPVTTVLAKSAPGNVGNVTGVPPPEGAGMGADGRAWAVLAPQGR